MHARLRRSYAHFCACGKMLDARLEHLGAKRLAGRADVNREDWRAVDAWIEAAVAGLDSLKLKAHKDIAGAAFVQHPNNGSLAADAILN